MIRISVSIFIFLMKINYARWVKVIYKLTGFDDNDVMIADNILRINQNHFKFIQVMQWWFI